MMKHYSKCRINTMVLILSSFFMVNLLNAQSDFKCGFDLLRHERLDTLSASVERKSKPVYRPTTNDELLRIPIKVHIVRAGNGSSLVTMDQVRATFDRMNKFLNEGGISISICGEPNYINNDQYYDYDPASEEIGLCTPNDVPNVLNLYLVREITGAAGIARLPSQASSPWSDRIWMGQQYMRGQDAAFLHELGHSFGLYHTHETEHGGAEFVDGSNCAIAGDSVCDTPADPGLWYDNVDYYSSCQYIGGAKDSKGMSYDPHEANPMSYSPHECGLDNFTPQQYERMRSEIIDYRSNLLCSMAPKALFNSSITQSCNDTVTVKFWDNSSGTVTNWAWDFGDGSSSTEQNPTHKYTSKGEFNVKLTVSGSNGSDFILKSRLIQVGVVSLPYSNNFESATPLENVKMSVGGRIVAEVQSNEGVSNSKGLVLYAKEIDKPNYYYQDGKTDVFFENNNYQYRSSVSFCVDATNLNSLNFQYNYKTTVYIAGSLHLRVLVNGQEVKRYNLGTSPTTWTLESLNLNAYVGQVVKITIQAVNQYNKALSSIYLDNVNITGTYKVPVANFTSNYENSCAEIGDKVMFTDMSTGKIDSWFWDFGADATPATAIGKGPHEVTYAKNGLKAVALTTTNQTGSNTANKNVEICVLTSTNSELASKINIYPNPIKNVLNINNLPEEVNLKILSIQGEVLVDKMISESELHYSMDGFSEGVYLVQLSAENFYWVEKFVLGQK